MGETEPDGDPARIGRQLLRRQQRGTLATSMRGAPYASLVLVAADLDASPLLLLSDLAQHTRNLAADPRCSLLFDGTAGYAHTLRGPPLSAPPHPPRTPPAPPRSSLLFDGTAAYAAPLAAPRLSLLGQAEAVA